MPFNVAYYHFIWTTKQKAPFLSPEIERLVYSTINETSKELHSPILAINGLEDHIHVVARVALKIAVSDWIHRVKGTSARAVNSTYPDLEQRFRWQEGYGVLTFGAKIWNLWWPMCRTKKIVIVRIALNPIWKEAKTMMTSSGAFSPAKRETGVFNPWRLELSEPGTRL